MCAQSRAYVRLSFVGPPHHHPIFDDDSHETLGKNKTQVVAQAPFATYLSGKPYQHPR